MENIKSIQSGSIKPAMVRALNVLDQGKVPAKQIDTRPGPSGKTLSYVKHTYATKLLQDGLGPLWSFEVLHWEVFRETLSVKGAGDKKVERESVSVATQCKLTVLHPILNTEDEYMKQTVTEVGAFEKNAGMPTAMAVGAAASRGLCRCMMRMIGLGMEFYDKAEPEITPTQAWNILKSYLERRGIEWDEDFKEALTKALELEGISSDNIVDKFTVAYKVANTFLGDDEDIPI
jgi:hypothetical protein